MSTYIKPLNLLAMDEGGNGIRLASNLISAVVPHGSFDLPLSHEPWVPGGPQQLACIIRMYQSRARIYCVYIIYSVCLFLIYLVIFKIIIGLYGC